jgi:hypothetical protein
MRKGKKAYKAKKAKGVVRIKKGEVRIKRAKAKLKAGYNPQTGRLTGRAKPAQKRLEKRAEQLMAPTACQQPRRKQLREQRCEPTRRWIRGQESSKGRERGRIFPAMRRRRRQLMSCCRHDQAFRCAPTPARSAAPPAPASWG